MLLTDNICTKYACNLCILIAVLLYFSTLEKHTKKNNWFVILLIYVIQCILLGKNFCVCIE